MSNGATAVEPDVGVLEALASADMSGFENLYRSYYRRVYAVCLRITRNVTTAEDLTQEVFVQLHRKLGSFRGEAAFATWLHRLTVNYALMYLRKRYVRSELLTEDGTLPDIGDAEGPGVGDRTLVDRLFLSDAIEKLPPGYRRVLLLHDVDGYEHEEIGRLIGVSAGTSKSQLFKARRKMRRALEARQSTPALASSGSNGRGVR